MGDVLQDREGAVAIVTLNRPAKLNALDAPMLEQLSAIIEAAESDDAIRVILLRGEGRSFCAGVDRAMVGTIDDEDDARPHAERMARAQMALLLCRKPLVAAVQGHALGAGCGLVAACDHVVAEAYTVFGYPEIANAMLPALVAPGLVRAIGHRRALALLLSSRRIDAGEALQLGLVTAVAARDALSEAMAFARTIAGVPAGSARMLKTICRQARNTSLEEAMASAVEANIAHRLGRT